MRDGYSYPLILIILFLVSWVFTSALTAFVLATVAIMLMMMARNYSGYRRSLKEQWRTKRAAQAAYESNVGKYAEEIAAHNAEYCRENNITTWTALKTYLRK
jgi:hypothetical protein